MSFGDRQLDRALDRWLTTPPVEYFMEEDDEVVCSYCDGNGIDADDDDEGKTCPRRKCPQCKGTGKGN